MLQQPLPSHTTRNRRAAVLLAAMLTTGLAGQAAIVQAAEPFDPGTMPAAESITITALSRPTPEGYNAQIDLQFKNGRSLPAEIPLRVADGTVVLRQDAKNVGAFSAVVPFDFETFVAEQAKRRELAEAHPRVPVFRGREVVDYRPLGFLDPERLARQIRDQTPIEIPEEAVTGGLALVNPARSLMIVNPRVVEDPDRTFDACSGKGNAGGAWTFNRLMTDMANQPLTGVHPADFVEAWLKSWLTTQNVNTFDIEKRTQMLDQVLAVWPRDSKGRLILKESPMRLLAIVNRLDLRKNTVYGGGSAGEGRFVFGVMRRQERGGCEVLPFTVILEYGIPLERCEEIRAFGQQWHDLDALVLGSPGYNAALQDITDQFATANAAPHKPNGSAINQVRTNENALDRLWELREFHLDPHTSHLLTASTELTPHRATYNPTPLPHTTTRLADFINLNEVDILANNYVVPEIFMGKPFLTGASLNPDTSASSVWDHPAVINNDARHMLSLNTCDSCHGGETQTKFLHVEPRNMGAPSGLSRFLVGSPGSVSSPGTFTMPDPVSSVPRTFGDLLHRQTDLDALVSSSCRATGLVEELFNPMPGPRTH
ncbi:Putative lipoprotein [Dokdonella koreensis DS-123]|uniref:Lipoprotein n=2 Tax=Dokdonella TaxID=323413 RepID=A0A160DUB7_9GAMM|nr:Putative lipoprotein [Dokdonella koreensis DS-123]